MALTTALLFAAGTALAQSGEMKGMDMKGMEMKGMEMSKGDKGQMTHKATGVVKSVDKGAGTVTLNHDPVKTMSWPAMTMAFKVQDKAMLDKVEAGKKVEVEFQQKGKDYVITKLK
jgi:Cu(I)/Ag(I) efflux system protein CusF